MNGSDREEYRAPGSSSASRRRFLAVLGGVSAAAFGTALYSASAQAQPKGVTCGKGYHWDSKTRTCVKTKNTGGCFLTTACCDEIGLSDDCFELVTLRKFRDLHMASDSTHALRLADYAALAPKVLAALPADRRRAELLKFYTFFILPSAVLARLGLYELTRSMYTWGGSILIKRYAPEAATARLSAG